MNVAGLKELTRWEEGSLSLDGEAYNDYTLKDDEISAWITVGNISVYVHRTDEGVVVDLFPRGREDDEILGSTCAFFSEAETQDDPDD